ncbi:alpha/beta hydrolase [Nocardioides sp.]|uniref:alpha/beta hydrolase n=1 Tax=Nocardioides sp. TaxID=35761 RepID=UPI0039E39E03
MKRLTRPATYAISTLGNTVTTTVGSAEKLTFDSAMTLPAPAQRALAGRPVKVDGQVLAVDVQLMLRLAKAAGPAVETLPIEKGRKVMQRQTVLSGGEEPVGKVQTVWTDGGKARLYTPTGVEAPGPLLVFYHGGGFIYGDLDSHDAAVRFLCEKSGVRVLSVEYRLAPEALFPAAAEDALAAFGWARQHAEALGALPDRIGVGGDSAGGNLAAVVALQTTTECAFQLLVYPVTQLEIETRSRELFRTGFYLTKDFMDLAMSSYVPADVDPVDPLLSPLAVEVPAGVAPAFVATAGFDPLRDEGEQYAAKLAEAGVPVESWRYADQIHGFFNTLKVPTARAACADIADALHKLAIPNAS